MGFGSIVVPVLFGGVFNDSPARPKINIPVRIYSCGIQACYLITNTNFLTKGNDFVFTNVYDVHARVMHDDNISKLVRNEGVDIFVTKN